MSLFLKSLHGKQVLQVVGAINRLQTKQCHWLPKLKPGPYPKTEEERIAAAKKYNLLPEEYEPYPDDGTGVGDYPKLPYEAVDEKDLYYNWDHKVLSRDFMEPLPRDIMHLLPYADSPSEHENTKKGSWIFLQFCGTILLCCYILSHFRLVKPLSEKQLLNEGKVHYSFEIDHDFEVTEEGGEGCVCPQTNAPESPGNPTQPKTG